MGSDRARISYDKTREYRSVVAQQGRVTLEADVNEEAVIASEALRYETIDIIGPTGTPDNGYLVSVDAGGNLTVGPGIMYVGGWRMRFPQPVPVADQPEEGLVDERGRLEVCPAGSRASLASASLRSSS